MNNAAVEIERKYIIRMPKIDDMKKCDGYSESEILQIYVESPVGITHRVRRRTTREKTVYTETKKIRIDKMSSYEDEREIKIEEFEQLAARRKAETLPINKTRYAFYYKDQLFEVDIYPEWKRSCIMETELSSREVTVEFPTFIKLIREVTGDKAYSNASMSKRFPEEDLDV